MNSKRHYLGYLLYLVPIAIILLSYGAIAVATGESEPFTIVSGPSMQPTILPGSIAVITRIPFQNLQVGDIIVFQPLIALLPGSSCQSGATPTLVTDAAVPCYVIHRIVEITRNAQGQIVTVRTKGDDNTASIRDVDFPINASMYVGKVVLQFPIAGYITQYPYNVTIAALILFALFGEIYFERRNEPKRPA